MNSSRIVQKLWNHCNVLQDDGMSYGGYPSAKLMTGVEQFATIRHHIFKGVF